MCLYVGGLCHTIIYVFIIGLLSTFEFKATEGLVEVTKGSSEDINPEFKSFAGFRRVKEAILYNEIQRAPKKYQHDRTTKQKTRSNSSARPRFINLANPFGVFGTPSCQHQNYEGTCIETFQCWALGGKVGPICRRLRGVCCRFFRTCDQRSSQEVVYFSNNKFDGSIPSEKPPPKSKNQFADPPPECSFQVVTRNRNFCGVRIEPSIDASLVDTQASQDGTIDHETCADAVLSIVGVGDRLDLSLCNQRDAFEKRRYDINITGVRDFKLKVSSFGRAGSPVDVKIRQIKCEEFSGEDLSGTIVPGGGTSGGGTSGSGTSGGGTSGGTTEGGTSGGTSGGGTTESGGGATTGSGGVQPPAPPIPVTQEPPSPPAPPVPVTDPPGPPAPIPPPGPNFASCGIKGPGRRSKTKEKLLNGIENLEDALENPVDGPEGPPIRSFSNLDVIYGPEDPLEQKLEDPLPSWDVPSNNETLFSYLMGEPSLLSTRITSGLETRPNEFPWQVAMFKSDNKFHCGASIIGDYYVLTAGHCVINFQSTPQSLVLRLGEWSLSSNSGGAHVNAHIAKITVHPEYSRTNLQNDLAVLKLKQRIDFSGKMRPVCLPKSDIPLTGELATITGWGKNEHGSLVDRMNKLTAVILDNKDCSSKWGGSGFIKPSMMCMDSQIGDSCNGDSGGPSVIEYPANSGKFFQVGIVSFGSGSCTDKNLPGVYTRIGYFRDWIIRQMI